MHILLFTQYYKPEIVGPGVYLSQLNHFLIASGHEVTVLTGFPNYPTGQVFEEYRGKVFQHENIDGVRIVRSWLYATASKRFWIRAIGFLSFTFTSLIGGLFAIRRADVMYIIPQPLTLGVTGVILAKRAHARIVLNIQDIHPQAVVAVGKLKNRFVIRLLEWFEKWIYRHAHHIIVIAEGFRDNLSAKGVPTNKISVVPNWADADFIKPGPRDNAFRQEINVGSSLTLIYSGSLSNNANLEPVVEAAIKLHDEPFAFVFVGEGVRKEVLQGIAKENKLSNLQFMPFQPLEIYPDVLRAADINLVSLSTQAALVSVPSKIFKCMAAGRPILAITASDNDVDRIIRAAACGICVPPDDPCALVDALRWAAAHPKDLERMGCNARTYFEHNYSSIHCTKNIERILRDVGCA